MDSRGAFIIFVLLFFLFAAPEPHQPAPISKAELQKQLDAEQRALSWLNSSSYGDLDSQHDRWLPLAGLTKRDGFAWGLLPIVQDRARQQLQFILGASGISVSGSSASQPHALTADSNLTALALPVYRNVTGRIRGDWVRWRKPELANRPNLNLTHIATKHDYFTREFGRNITTNNGHLVLDFQEEVERGKIIDVNGVPVREIKVQMLVEANDGLGESWTLALFGVHFPTTGAIVLTTASEKFAGVTALPHFTLSRDSFRISRQLLSKSLSDALKAKQSRPEHYLPWSSLPHGPSTVAFPSPKCEYIAYLQQHPVMIGTAPAQEPILDAIENELRFPRGAPIPNPPPMVMSAAMFSPDCGFVLESKGPPAYAPQDNLYLSGLKREEQARYAKRFIVIIAGIFILQINLLMRQMKESSTPSTRSRVSFYTIAMMSMGDALLISFVMVQLWSEASFLLMTATSFLAFFSISFLGMKFQIEIWTIQEPERRGSDSPSSTQSSSEQASTTLPPPAAAATPRDTGATPVILPPDQDGPDNEAPSAQVQTNNESGTSAGAMYTRFYFTLFSLFFLSSWVTFWPTRLAAIYADVLIFIYLSFWIPQIHRNIMRNCRKALRWEFVIGESILRIFPFVYFYIFPRNALLATLSSTEILVFVLWVWIQNWLLVSQDILGPRFFIPKTWVPPAYDYHPILRDASASGSGEDLESGDILPISSLRAEQRDVSEDAKNSDRPSTRDRRKKVFDCAICMQDIEVPVLLTPGSGVGSSGTSVTESAASLLSRRAYMITPCRHIFHSPCLETWMRLRLQCPICRESIPPI
ncbi:conserved hypothetical protein [Uncinocarpus reesii 1704]|uniref:DSC E3 ubiquitin ligase complex subunit A n=1 Tax=Uncinocarpus reesii (strain UAMH 1704) TaxID=336963 RepID=C4JQL8_UNCRE|nr:uncharacterized protein UREG_03363 [Uncinocarpus reesii 1704]EEP78517.1 conserved hypothetical protein [Uncinocarpus reesii 1704]